MACMSEALQAKLGEGRAISSLRIVYEFKGDLSCDSRCGVTERWTQRQNPFMGKGLNGTRVLECLRRMKGHLVWYAKDITAGASQENGVLFSLFNYKRGPRATLEEGAVESSFKELAGMLRGKHECYLYDADPAFNIDGMSFSSVFGPYWPEDGVSKHYKGMFMVLNPTSYSRDVTLDCCELHRCISYVDSRSVSSKSVEKYWWFFAPLTWLDAACGVHDDGFYYSSRGEPYKDFVPSELSDLEAVVMRASQFRHGSDAHLRVVSAFKRASVSARRSFFNAPAYFLTAIGSLLLAWCSRNKSRAEVKEMTDFLHGLVTVMPGHQIDAVLQEMYTRFTTDWQCTVSKVVTTTILALIVSRREQLCAAVHAVLNSHMCFSTDVHKLVQDYVIRDGDMPETSVSLVKGLLASDMYATAAAWWFASVVENISYILSAKTSGLTENVSNARREIPCSCTADTSSSYSGSCEHFHCMVAAWRDLIDEYPVLERFDMVVQAISIGANPFWYFKHTPKVLGASIDPLELIMLYWIAHTQPEACRNMWEAYTSERLKPFQNAEAYIRRLNKWSPLLKGYHFAARALVNVSAEIDEDSMAGLNCHWRAILGKEKDGHKKKARFSENI